MEIAGFRYELVWEPDARLGWRHIVGAKRHWTAEGDGWIEINQEGYRDRSRHVEKAPGTYRVAVFGDSMTEAVQVNLNQTFTYIAEEKLQHERQNVEVLNFGVNGYGPLQELLLFKEEGPRYRPDLVILAVFLDNDVADGHPKLAVGRGRTPFLSATGDATRIDYAGAEESSKEYRQQPQYWLRRHSGLYRLLSEWRWRTRDQVRVQGAQTQGTIPVRFLLYKKSTDLEWEEAWSVFERILLEFAEEAARQETRLVVLSVPIGFVVNPEAWDGLSRTYPAMKDTTWDLEGPEQRLRAFTQEHGIPLIPAYQEFRKAPKSQSLYWGGLGHFNPAGHQVMAGVLSDHLKTRWIGADRTADRGH